MKFKKLGKTGFEISVCGFGSYRVDNRVQLHQEALRNAISSGINLIDTSANYADGGSEILIGNILKEFPDKEIFVVTKGGYIQGSNLQIAKQREASENPYPEIVKCSPELWHSIHPDFLKDQISLSLERLQMDYVDVYLLHNPEYFLLYTSENEIDKLRAEYYRRIKIAFEYLEEEVKKGRIKYYGISSNTFGANPDEISFTSLEKVFEIAKNISSENHFAVVQAPLNLIEKDIAKNQNQQNDSKTFLEFAHENNLGVLVNRPLNAIDNNQIVRLADFEIKENRNKDEVLDLLNDVYALENEIKEKYFSSIPEEEIKDVEVCLFLTQTVKPLIDQFKNVAQFREMKAIYFLPRINFAMKNIYTHNPESKNKLNNYAVNVDILLDSIESLIAKEENNRNKILHDELNNFLDEEGKNSTLSQKAILMINSLEEVSSILVGMRKKDYVADILKSIKSGSSNNANQFWKI